MNDGYISGENWKQITQKNKERERSSGYAFGHRIFALFTVKARSHVPAAESVELLLPKAGVVCDTKLGRAVRPNVLLSTLRGGPILYEFEHGQNIENRFNKFVFNMDMTSPLKKS